ncbi:MAG: type II secretion system F family protein [Planctomycetota bacterium]|jgi:tight adherence protein C
MNNLLPMLATTGIALQMGLSVAIFASVFMGVLGLFGHSGRIRISPQREAALATGHSDRRTVFEKPLIRSIMWVLLGMSHGLIFSGLKRWTRSKLTASGNPDFYTVEEYLALSMLTGVVLGVALMLFVMLPTGGQISLFWAAVGFVVGFVLNLYHLHNKAAKRVLEIGRRLPYAMDLVALAMGAGATFVEAVQTVVRERAEDPFNVELKTMLAEMDLGTTRRRALENMAGRIPLEQLRSIVSSVIQAEELGTPLADVLHSQANLLRLQRSVKAENAAAVASVRILLPSLLILMAVVLAVFAPAIVRGITGGLY